MDKQYAVIGLGKFGYAVAQTLSQAGKQFWQWIKTRNGAGDSRLCDLCCTGRCDGQRVFESLGISNMDVVIIGISEDMESSILATLQAKEAGVPLVIAKGMNQMHAKIRKDRCRPCSDGRNRNGYPSCKNLISGGFQDFFMLSDSFSMVELAVPDSWSNHNLEELNLRKKYEI